MCVGVLFSAAFELVGSVASESVSPVTILSDSLNTKHFFLGMLVSPIVFGIVSSQLTLVDHMFPALLLCFQNGFFWQTVFKKAEGSNNLKGRDTSEGAQTVKAS
jgi:hypothetical protein